MIKTSLLSIPKDVRESVNDIAQKLNYTVDFVIRGSNASEDNYLYYVVAHRTRTGLYKPDGYACWVYNHSLRQFGSGRYDLSEGLAIKTAVSNVFLVEANR